MKIEELIGLTVVKASSYGNGTFLKFDDGSELKVGQGDAGTMRNPEPYFYAELLSGDDCRSRDDLARRLEHEAMQRVLDDLNAKDRWTSEVARVWPPKKRV